MTEDGGGGEVNAVDGATVAGDADAGAGGRRGCRGGFWGGRRCGRGCGRGWRSGGDEEVGGGLGGNSSGDAGAEAGEILLSPPLGLFQAQVDEPHPERDDAQR
jgi:hypothetical protein